MVQGVWGLRAVVASPDVVVFGFNASSADGVVQQINWLNAQSAGLILQPLADMEFVHPAANFVLYSTGVYSQVSTPPDVPTNFRSLLNAQPASPLYH